MSKLMIAMPSDKTPPLYDFFNDELNEKQRQKLLSLFALMLQAPVSVMREPYVKPVSYTHLDVYKRQPRWSRASRTITAFCSYQAML